MDKLISPLNTQFDGINTNYLCSLSDGELDYLLDYITQEEIDPTLFLYLAIENTMSMEPDEKQYWNDIAPSMTTEQIKNLIDILCVEKRKIERIEIQYSSEIKYMNKLLEIIGDGKGNLMNGWQELTSHVSDVVNDRDGKLVENWVSIMEDLSNDLRPDGELRDGWEAKIANFKNSLPEKSQVK